ncbi:MAG: hypothetical protein K1X57_00935 [Gemmataceae bacterium]|nr:hypothetical protein [Gemmataceae bacterium]
MVESLSMDHRHSMPLDNRKVITGDALPLAPCPCNLSTPDRIPCQLKNAMRLEFSMLAVTVGALAGAALRFALTFSEVHNPGWFWWYQHGLHSSPGTAGFASYVDGAVFTSNNKDFEFCVLVSILPGLFGGALGAASAAIGRPLVGAASGGVISGLVLLLMRLPEVYRPGWRLGGIWWDYNVPMIVEAVAVGAVIGLLAGFIGQLLRPWDRPTSTSA